ncbi:MAG TPA: 2-oxo acid dehydrogenase subunit E2, partial [Nitrososphaerales archaeon]|nr:2-oxo acid dehydrogenase subunit E2 [Nitrososphaerales archaeon]
MSEELNMPQMGYDMKEGVVIKWLKEEGSEVKIGEPVAEIETDKAVVEFESYAEGILEKILVEEGSKVNVGEPIAIVGDGTNIMEEEEEVQEE